jgi:hypothetical protein
MWPSKLAKESGKENTSFCTYTCLRRKGNGKVTHHTLHVWAPHERTEVTGARSRLS